MFTRSLTLLTFLLAAAFLAACAGQQSPADAPAAAPSTITTTAIPSAPAVVVSPAPATVAQKPAFIATPLPAIVVPTPLPTVAQSEATHDASPVPPQPATTPVPLLTPAQSAPETLESLRGQILFRSDRSGGFVQLYVMNPDGTGQRLCDCSDVLQAMVKREVASPDGQLFLFIKNVGGSLRLPTDQQIWSHNNRNNYEALVTGEAPGFPGVDYEPVWSPDSRHIGWVSETDGNDEIYLRDTVTGENKRLSANDKAWDKHPSFSPDGSQIVFWSNRESAVRKQIWLMNLDGSQARNISQNQYNDYDPLWVK